MTVKIHVFAQYICVNVTMKLPVTLDITCQRYGSGPESKNPDPKNPEDFGFNKTVEYKVLVTQHSTGWSKPNLDLDFCFLDLNYTSVT